MDNSDIQNKSCLNCSGELPEKALYCPFCGQKDTDGRISIGQFFNEFLDSVFNLDSKFYKSFIHVFFPARLTIEYFRGRHKRYSHPLRIFFITAVIHLSVIALVTLNSINDLDIVSAWKTNEAKDDVYSLIDGFENIKLSEGERIQSEEILDSLRAFLIQEGNIDTSSSTGFTTGVIDFDSVKVKNVEISRNDIINLTPNEILEKYEITHFVNRVMVSQTIKAITNPKELIRFGIGNMVWMLFVLMPLLALLMKLLYIRRKFFFIEHLVFLYHWHSFDFMVMSIYFLLMHIIHPGLLGLFFFIILVFGFIALRRYYKQGFFKSLIKYLILLFSYFVLLIILFSVTSLISMLIF